VGALVLAPLLTSLAVSLQVNFFHLCLVNREPHQISMSSLFKGVARVAIRPLFSGYSNIYPLSLQQILAPLMSSCGYTHALCRKDGEERPRRAARGFLRSCQAKDHAEMRLTCGSAVVGGGVAHLKLLLAARGAPETGFEPRCGRGIASPKFANFVKCRASRMQTRC
jgi:hypothetical protein